MFTELIDPRPKPAEGPEALARFLQLFSAALATPRAGQAQSDEARGHAGRGQPHACWAASSTCAVSRICSWCTGMPPRDITKNHPAGQAVEVLKALLTDTYRHAHLHTPMHELQLSVKHKGGRDKSYLRVDKRTVPAPRPADSAEADAGSDVDDIAASDLSGKSAHNRAKERLLDLEDPVWVSLGITHRPQGSAVVLVPAMARKWKQINRFTEIFGQAIAQSELAQRPEVRVIDFGCGKGYLTFAIHAWLRSRGQQALVTGVELRQELVDQCNAIAREQHRDGLQFDAGDVRDYTPAALDVVIALHACDTATDHAISPRLAGRRPRSSCARRAATRRSALR